ncbi:hypothetical protein [Streptacidiphilus carbonis]|uniref:hypothetical protein n=1 Tax=Streptacidiphilus carbonis TaxID=105422 RepID=UPI0005A96586|nr:hypothetical protein [Streptacidiphilus carbonis]
MSEPQPQGPPQPQVVETGHDAVDAALAGLGEVGGVPTEAHAAVYESVHQALRDTLNALDTDPLDTATNRRS